ncbi:PAS domain-containing sensor histidine kinase [Lamprobacter modestohalophilus]|uniref:Phosphate regulon sensor protein PhoR n=1 Tax=Lamprobacter modestohalophilus TaxID=1064514 RepID=A0A9X0W6J4_9GAMM|nr:phosphate regulon sensor histidine kinase PhoR [Lamprobacter modestohalophilus]MBK1617797.1 PAS domain-containing sensor histidine kinase [Lamprobacter modestohalophilus]
MRNGARYELGLLFAAGLGAALLIGLGLGWAEALLIALCPLLARHAWNLFRLARLIRRQHRLVPPFPSGIWGDIYRAIGQYQQRGRKGRKRQLRFFRRFREAANSVPDALVVLDKNRRIEWANPAAQVLMDVHWPRDDGRALSEVFEHPELSSYIVAGEYARPLEVAPAHNRSVMLSIRVAPFGERKKQRLVVGRDITKVFHLNLIRRDFVANASHELRTPLTVITGFLETLADSALTPAGHRRPLNRMQHQAERMRSIIEDLLTLSRLEMDEQALEVHPVDVAEELEQIVADASALSSGRHQFQIEIDHELMLLGKASELRSAFSNILFNAVKHTPPGSHIQLSWSQTASGPVLTVTDDGPGIAPKHIPRLTERFYRVDKARSRESGGTGLGLAIVKHVLSRHQARLVVASEPGQGTQFSCHFPPEQGLSAAQLEHHRQANHLPPLKPSAVPASGS